MILVYANDIDPIGSSTTKIKKMFTKIEKETKKVGLDIKNKKMEYMHVNRRAGRNSIGLIKL